MQESINKLILEIFNQSTVRTQRTNGHAQAVNEEQSDCGHDDESVGYQPESMDLLYAYIEAELDELNAGLMFPEVHKQLASNRSLQESYRDLRELLVMERENRWVEPPLTPSFDFSYLKQQPTLDALLESSWSVDQIGRLVIEFTSELLQCIRPLDLQPAMLKSGQSGHTDKMYHYVLENQVENLNVEIGVKADLANPSRCHVAAWVAIPSLDGWPNWKDSRVDIKLENKVIQSQTTDAFGRVLFEPIEVSALPHLTFEVTPATLVH